MSFKLSYQNLATSPTSLARGERPGSRLTQNQGKSPEPDTKQLDKVFPHVIRDGTEGTRSGSMRNPAKAAIELSQKTRRWLSCDMITKLAEDSI